MHTIQTERLVIRPLTMADLHSTHAYAGNPKNTRYMLFLPHKSLQETEQFLAKVVAQWQKEAPDFYEFAVILGNRHIGGVDLYLEKNRTEGELGWVIHRDFGGNGYITEAATALKEFAFEVLGLRRLYARCDCRNTASFRIMEKLGMSLEQDDAVRYDKTTGEPVKELMYSVSRQYF